MNIATFIAGRISFRSKRTFSKMIVRIAITGIMLGLGVMILSLAIVKGFKQEIREKVRGFSGDIQIVKYDLNVSYENSPFTADPALLRQITTNNAFTHLSAFATKPAIIKANDAIEGVVLKGVDQTYNWSFFKKNMSSGRVLDFKDSVEAQKQIMISQFTADRLKLKVGDDFLMYFVQQPLRKRKFKIVGIFNVGVEEVDKTFVIGSLSLIRRLNDWKPNEVGGYELQIPDFNHLEQSETALNNFLPIELKSFTVEQFYPTIFEWLSLLDINTQVILVLMLIVAVINMISALLIMILERTNMIGILKAMGANNWSIQQMFLLNALYLIGAGLVLGNLFGVGISYFQNYTHFFKLDQASYYMNFVPIQLHLMDVLLLNIGTLVVCVLVLLIPSMLVSSISPVKAIRFK
ncbi:ABC transporter permease [Mucilaginibacter arboris]|uniref:FtsX-like permease family protein n=1 Tax=Mucilaginibacter arboris TaxID=2682090 RepID=A0A7K1T0Z2_9SPHI|nr:FtsX-like permease family protein [Mucilaginibacter arboris]MVN23191.1 FtsX-like permease family protein [Mucilaginibacter arboris]